MNAIAVMRISSDRQQMEGDSIEHQKGQIDNYALSRDITIKKYFVFIESASKEQQPVQEAIDYCKNKKNNIDLFIIKSIDRFTRGGSSLYDTMKTELHKHGVRLVDLYGVISHQEVNTLAHLGVAYSWSVYNPSKKSELLEAERGKDEVRDIMSRMIGSEIYYTRLGYRVHDAPFGYQNERIETVHGKRLILSPHPKESVWIKKIFELKEQNIMTDAEVIEHVNLMGFKTRKYYFRNRHNKSKIIGIGGQNQLTVKKLDAIVKNPIYTGITVEKWTNNKPLKCQFQGLISIETFNNANKGRIMIIEEKGELQILTGKPLRRRIVNTAIGERYPYKRLILCPGCKKQFGGSASRGRSGTYYPAYHCSKGGHYYRIPVQKFHDMVVDYLHGIRIKTEFIHDIQSKLAYTQETNKQNSINTSMSIQELIAEIDANTKLTLEKIKLLNSEIALRSLEDDLEKLETEKKNLLKKQTQLCQEIKIKKIEVKPNMEKYDYRLPHSVIIDHDCAKKTYLFQLLFSQQPTYEDILNKTATLNREFELSDQT